MYETVGGGRRIIKTGRINVTLVSLLNFNLVLSREFIDFIGYESRIENLRKLENRYETSLAITVSNVATYGSENNIYL